MAAISAQDHERIKAVVANAETRTSAEFVLVVAEASDDYALYPLLWAAFLALAAGGLIAVFRPLASAGWLFPAQALVFVASGLILHLKPLRHRLTPGRVKRAQAAKLARQQFSDLVQSRTHDQAGVLLFVSLAEHHVEILTDRAISQLVAQSEWQAVVENFVAQVRAGQVTEALVTAVEACTVILAGRFPPTPGQKNEIHDSVIEI